MSKVTSINPGTVKHANIKGWTYTIVVNGTQRHCLGDAYYRSANDAKQAMRESVSRLRKHHVV